MMKAFASALAATLLATSAQAGNCRLYLCGKTKVHVCLYKEEGKVAGDEVTITTPSENLKFSKDKMLTSGTFLYKDIETPVGYFVNGKKYKCKQNPIS
jgi:hypothetical protein